METISKEKFVGLMGQLAGSVYDFHERFDIPEITGCMSDDEIVSCMQRRVGLQLEELAEFSRAMYREDFGNMREEIIDNLYVAMGNALLLGYGLSVDISSILAKNDYKTPQNYMARYYK